MCSYLKWTHKKIIPDQTSVGLASVGNQSNRLDIQYEPVLVIGPLDLTLWPFKCLAGNGTDCSITFLDRF